MRKLTRDRALTLAHRWGVPAASNPGLNAAYPKGTACCSDADVFDSAGIPVLSVEATNWSLGKKDGYQQRAKSRTFPRAPAGMTRALIISSTSTERCRGASTCADAKWST